MNYVLVKCFEHLLGDRVLHKEAWVATHLGTHLLIQVQICQICWQGYLGSVDHVDKLYYILSADLNIKDETELRFIPMGKEVTERRALLRYSRFFLNDTLSIYTGKFLGKQQNNFEWITKQRWFQIEEYIYLTPISIVNEDSNEESYSSGDEDNYIYIYLMGKKSSIREVNYFRK